ncbi:type IV toxin-antitoxin system AbiEi family antitoxin domain-containing protein [Arthrobacter sp. C9C5]|uniref:type IV toxin-antitoxin system AbiEi family antitoxin domain-containing protein n=1 Tax=Arthrobacter sp. C9C5 TaxID=2735267 RepID=UPI001584C5E7|nr:type IV toxin-antitoxin system AbiEi family antitoxin domain-containing protein [Arthrobacter sp. C9C5]NUU30688.1 type IV toxin-antitoxin system AbiEi family antitoxin domain-containing protein [Arthrobacter sp. C9C5]
MDYPVAQPEDPLAAVWDGSAGSARPLTPAPELSTATLSTTLPEAVNLWRTEELLDRGLSARQILQLTADGALVKLRRGCYVRRSFWAALDANGASRCRIEAYAHRRLTSSTGTYVFSHTTAARLHGLFLWQVGDTIHLTVPFLPSSGGHASDVKAHTRSLAPADIVHVAGHRVTSLARTAVDSCLVLNYSQGLILMDHALRLGASREALELECARLRGAPGVATLKKVLAHADPLSESPGETLVRDLVRRLRLPAPQLQFEVRTRLGKYRLDCAWPERSVALEFDGRGKYFDYAPTAEAIFAERRREKALMELGWKFIRVEWRDLFREQELKTRLLRVLGR